MDELNMSDTDDTSTDLEKCSKIGLPKCNTETIALPYCFIRSSLFSAAQRKKQKNTKNSEIKYETETNVKKYATGKIEINFSGEELVQSDINVWGECVKRAIAVNFEKIEFTYSNFLNALKKFTGQSDREWLLRSIERLAKSTVIVKDDSREYTGNLIDILLFDKTSKTITVKLNPTLKELFKNNNWKYFNIVQRNQFGSKPLALFLFSYYSSHELPYPIKVETLKKLSGSKSENIDSFKQQLKKALCVLDVVTAWKWKIENNLVYINKNNVSSTLPTVITTSNEVAIKKEIVSYEKNEMPKSMDGFDKFWEQYPKKENRIVAESLYIKNNCAKYISEILNNIQLRKSSNASWTSKNNQFVLSPVEYLTNERWTDEIYDGSDTNWMITASVNKLQKKIIEEPALPNKFFNFEKLREKK